ncbi:Adenosine 5'-monophosphoramidase, variant 2 [Orbilia oligospora]|uniref:Adenosine 5'-monophosphoramidase, variant 2 n=1 Tax=Orbilia oligospora TaxID=2813651 RepID=A0A6G1LYM6_ORBOL|nr:Adenosine 5'-monophosphoramidase, variant 2 [Orbilia oligospora]KAF3200304.1 Adenosine 5'-monophosphoramidase, variant 2 [Orbilia oligospora]KAF3212357.1 Adenosine 5'-monophosphoramidase, variant 2 [Orbilia oligospora]KAF3238615.1 Adenosine 5'-monophosphoramidase, variant 2 [Orbilia oligospora]
MAACIFCRIIKGEIPSFKLYDSPKVYAFLDIQPLSKGHALVIPKTHGEKLVDVPDDELAEMLPVAKKLALAVGVKDFNILQNNGRIAHQEVDHVHVHMVKLQYTSNYFDVLELTILTKIPKPNETEGLSVGWPAQKTNMEELKAYYEELKSKM